MASRIADFFRVYADEQPQSAPAGVGGAAAGGPVPSLSGLPIGLQGGGPNLRPSFGMPLGGNPAMGGTAQAKPPPPQYSPRAPYPGIYDYALNDVANVFNLPMFRTGCRMDFGHEFSDRQVNSLRILMNGGSIYFLNHTTFDTPARTDVTCMVNQYLEGKAGFVSEVAPNVVLDVQARFPRLLGPKASAVDLSSIMGSSSGTILGKLLVKFPATSLLFKMDTNRLVGASAMHSVSPYWAVGAEAYYRPDRGLQGSATAVHDTPDYVAGATAASTGMLWLQYLRKVSPNVGAAAQLRVSALTRECMAVAGYTFAFPKAGSRLGAYVTNEGNIMAALEERFSDKGRIVFGADCNPLKHEYRFGLGIQFGPAADTVQFARAAGVGSPDGGLSHFVRDHDRSPSHAKSAGRHFPIGWGDALPSPRPRMPFSPVMQQMGYRFY